MAQGKAATTTNLTVGPGASMPSGTVVTLTASVTANAGSVRSGQVNFCDASSSHCTDIHLLGIAQITGAGTATLKLRPGLGSHSYKAVFAGTNSYSGSTSAAAALTVTGTIPALATATTIDQTGGWGAYTLSATVTETGNTAAPTGLVSFLDTNHGNAILGSGSLGAATRGVAWSTVSTSAPNLAGVTYAVTDLNGDGIPDLFVKDYFGTYDVLLGKGDGTFTVTGAAFGPYSQIGPFIVGDFNNDGIPDVAAINAAYYVPNNTITIFLGNGDGTFTVAGSSPAVGLNPSGIVTADINGDGNADLIVSQQNSSNGEIVVLLGNGTGAFTQVQSTTSTYSVASTIFPADFNNDGKIDILVPNGTTAGASVLLGNGDGTFTVQANPGIPLAAQIAAADVNNDGKPDVILRDATSLAVYLGNGDGTFTQGPSSPASNIQLGTFVVGDLNLDGIPDIVYAVPGSTGVGLLFGKGDGTFVQTPASVAYGYDFSQDFVVADFNGDGWPDVLTIDLGGRTVEDSLTQPTETATASATAAIAVAGSHLAGASYPGDGHYHSSASGTIPLWGVPPPTATSLTITSGSSPVTGVAPGTVVTLTATVKTGTTPITSGQVNFCDASATRCADIHLLATAQLSGSGTASFKFVPGAGQHSYRAVYVESGWGKSSTSNVAALTVGPAKAPVYSAMTSIASSGLPGNYTLTATVEGFGGPAVPTGTVSFIDTSTGNTTLATAPLGTGTAGVGWLISQAPALTNIPIFETAGDFNGDGIPDLAVLWKAGAYADPGGFTVLIGKGDGTFTAGSTVPLSLPNQTDPYMIVGDFNNDGQQDLAILSMSVGNTTSIVTTVLGVGDGTFASPVTSTAFNQGAVGGDVIAGSIVAGDFNGDGKLDLAVAGDYVNTGGVPVLLGNGDGTFTAAGPNLQPNTGFGTIATGDFNGDGIPDLVAAQYFGPGGATVFLGKGDGTFTTGESFTVDTFPRSIVVADFNGDGVLDLVLGFNNGIETFTGKGDGTFIASPGNPIQGAGLGLVAGDFNHDGKLDLAGLDNYSYQIDLFIGGGDGSFTETVTTPNVSQNAPAPFAITAGDFNGDGVPDLAMLSTNVSSSEILLTEPTQTTTATVTGIAPIGAGTHNVEASFPGDKNYSAGVSSTIALTAGLKPLAISPAPGTYTSIVTITLSESIPGATIYYAGWGPLTTNGFVAYTGPITVSTGGVETIQAYATEAGYQQSDNLTAVYNLVLPQAASPVISPASGRYAGQQTVTISDATPGARIYYTTNGTPPTLNSTLYSGPVTVSSSETVVAAAVADGYSFSPVATAQYLIGSSSTSLIYTIAGTGTFGYTGDGGPATMAEINSSGGMVKDSTGNLYFSDEGNHMVRKIAAGTGIITRIAGTGVLGYSGDGGPATSAQLNYPINLALDSLNNLFIADSGNGTVRKLNLATGIITTYAGNPNTTNLGDGGPATAASLSGIGGIALDAARNLYIAQGVGVIRQVNDSTGIITTIAGTSGYNYSGDGGPAINATFRSPYGIAFDRNGNLYIADFGNDVVRKITAVSGVISGNSIISTVAGNVGSVFTFPMGGYSGDGGPATSAKLNGPMDVALDQSGNFYIADFYNSVIRKVTASSGIISTIAGNGGLCQSYGGDGGSALSASLCYPRNIALDNAGDVYIGDDSFSRVHEVFTPAAPPATTAAAPTFSITGGTFSSPQTVTISDSTPGASIYVTVDGTTPTTATAPGYSFPITVAGTVTIQAIATAPGYLTSAPASATYTVTSFSPIISTVAGTGTTGFSGSGGPALDAQFGTPGSIAINKSGDLYVSDQRNNVVWLISAATGTASVYAGNGQQGYQGDGGPATNAELYTPLGIALDHAGNLYIADANNMRIRKVDAATGTISTVAGSGYAAVGTSIGDGGPATQASLLYPTAVAFDTSDNLYIADSQHFVIRKVSSATGIITTVAGNGKYEFSGDGGAAINAGIQMPGIMAIDKDGNIYLGGSGYPRVRKVTAATGIITSVAGVADIIGNTGDGGPATSAQISPNAMTVDAAGNLYLGDWPGLIRKVDASTGVITKVAGVGLGGFSGDGGAAVVAQMLGPGGMAFDSAGTLFFADTYNYRIRKVIFTPQTATPAFSLSSGTYAGAQAVTITDATSGASIYYTTDGTVPSTSSTAYTGPLTVDSSVTINAIAAAAGNIPSTIASATYVIAPAPAPSLTSLTPPLTSAGGAAFTLTVNGAGFTAASTINWGSTALSTQYGSATQLTAQVSATQIASAGVVSVTVQTPAPGGGTSNALSFEVDTAGSVTPPNFGTTSVTVAAGATATYPVTLTSSATNVSVKCLNLPAGAACAYSASSGTLTITTANSTPSGTYTITAVFTETLPGAATALVLLPLLLWPSASRSKRKDVRLWIVVSLGLVFAVLATGAGCGGGGTGGSNPPPATHQATTSAAVTLIIK